LGFLVPIPFLDTERIKGYFGNSISYNPTDGHFSILMLGIMPYVSAYILVEIFSLFTPPLKKLRSGYVESRQKLKRLALFLSLFLAIYQAISIISGFQNWDVSGSNSILNISSTFEHVILVCVLVGSFYLLVVLCELISKFGIGHGISIIILSGICGDFISRMPMLFRRFEYYEFSSYFIALVVFCALISFTWVLLKTKISIPCYHENDKTTVDYFQLNLSPSSLAALTYAATIIMLPITLTQLFGIDSRIVNNLRPGSFWYNFISIICVLIFSFIFGWVFLHPHRRVIKMQARGWRFVEMGTTAEAFILKRQFIYNLPWTIFLCLMVVVPNILISGANVPFYLGGSSIPILVAIIIDLISGFHFYQDGIHRPIKIAEFHDIYDAGMIQNHMKAMGIKSYLRGYHHRLLRYFFGPHLEMSLIINDRDKERAKLIIQEFYSGLGLCRT
jgi:preprotein translocase subunit SecY